MIRRRHVIVAIAAGLLLVPLAALTGSAWRVHGFTDSEGWEVSERGRWQIDESVLSDVRSQLPTIIARRLKAHPDSMSSTPALTLRDFQVRLSAETRHAGQRVVRIEGDCGDAANSKIAASEQMAPEPPRPCGFDAVEDPQTGRILYLDDWGWTRQTDMEKYAQSLVLANCAGEHFKAAASLGALPEDIRRTLEANSEIGDHDAKFAGGCVTPVGYVHRRFVLAAIGDTRAFATEQAGGYAPANATWEFERRGKHWESVERHPPHGPPATSLQELLHQTCVGIPAPPTRNENAGDLIHGYVDDEAIKLDIDIEPAASYELRHVAATRTAPAHDDIRQTDHALSETERQALRRRLQALRHELMDDQPAYGYLTLYLKALEQDQASTRQVASGRRRPSDRS